jgi:HEAT repeat protein
MTPLEEARNPNTLPSSLEALANDKDWLVRSAVASNPNTPISSLITLVKDKNSLVRIAITRNPNTTPS